MAWLAQIMHVVVYETDSCLCKEATMTRNVFLPGITALALLASTPQLLTAEAQDSAKEGRQRSMSSQSSVRHRHAVQHRRRLPRTQPQLTNPTRKHAHRRSFQRPYWHGRRHRPIIAPRYFYPRISRPYIYPSPFTYRFGRGRNRIDRFGYAWRHHSYRREHYYYDRAHDYSGFLRLKIRPRDAQVYVDKIFAGLVDDFDGPFQRLRLDEGLHVVEVKKQGYEDFQFEMHIVPGEQETVDGLMLPSSQYR